MPLRFVFADVSLVEGSSAGRPVGSGSGERWGPVLENPAGWPERGVGRAGLPAQRIATILLGAGPHRL